MKTGDVIGGRFELDRPLGSGGMGEVFRALDRSTGEVVAVKVLLETRRRHEGTPSGEERAGDVARFIREAEVLAELRHPNIVRHIAHGVTTTGEPYLVMEWLEGEHLLARLMRKRLTAEESVALLGRVADALGAAHARGIVHRDLKPTNLFLEGKRLERVKLLDFGIAHLRDVTRMTRTGALLGTPGYMAPEQARSGQIIDARADVFALGCVLFECLSGAPAFKGDHVMSILAKILFEEAPRVREMRPDVPADLDALVSRMLAKDPDERPRDGGAVVTALGSLGRRTGVLDAPPASAPTTAHPRAITRGERRALSVVLMGRERASDLGEEDTVGAADATRASDLLRQEAEACGGRLALLADGSVVVTIAGARMATDQAAQAARCALALRKHSRTRPIALATGYGKVAGRMPVGAAIDRAAAMLSQRAAAPAIDADDAEEVSIDEVTAGLLDARFEVQTADDGLTLHAGRELAEGTRTLLGKPTTCVGRDWELGALKQILTECVEESVARAVLVTAAAGMGKSRVAHELLRMIRQRGDLIHDGPPVAIWMARGDSLRAGSAFGLLGDAIRAACGIREGEPLGVRREKLTARVAEHVPASEAKRVTAYLGELIGTPLEGDGEHYTGRRDAQRMGEQMRRAFEDFLSAECDAHPVLLVLEDLHWGDLPTVRFIDSALRTVKTKPWMVLALARPEVHDLFPKLWADRGLQEIRLKELTRRSSERLVRQVLGADVSQEIVDRLAAQADGNAFYLEELIRAVAERRGEALPETVVAMVQSRLSGLELEARRVLRAASIFGEVFWAGGVTALLGGAKRAQDLGVRLSELVDREALLRRPESRFPGEEELGFRHALLREGAYEALTEEDRALGHRLAGEWLLQHGERDPIVLAEHFERGGELGRAGGYYLAAVDQAHRGGDTDTAIARAKRALSCGVPDDVRLALLGMLCISYVYRPGSLAEAAPYIEEVMSKAAPGSGPWAQAASAKLVSALHIDKRDTFGETLYRVMQVQPAPDAAFPILMTLLNGVYILDAWGLIEDGNAVLERLNEIVASLSEREPLTAALLNVAHAIRDPYVHEDPWTALRRAETAKARFAEVNFRRGIATSQVYAGMNLWFLGALGKAEHELWSIESADDDVGSVHRSISLVFVLSERGALEEAALVASRLVDAAHARRHRMDEGRARWAAAEVMRRQGDLEGALREARAAQELLATAPIDRIAAAATLADVLLALRRAPEALAVAEEAMDKYGAMRACGFFRGASLRLIHAESLWAVGNADVARAAIRVARERLLANADKIGDAALRKSFLTSVPENARTLRLAQGWLGEEGA